MSSSSGRKLEAVAYYENPGILMIVQSEEEEGTKKDKGSELLGTKSKTNFPKDRIMDKRIFSVDYFDILGVKGDRSIIRTEEVKEEDDGNPK